MHEASIIQNIISIVQERIDDGSIAGRICKVYLRVGQLASVVPSNLQFLFGILTTGTPLEQASLEIVQVPLRFSCTTCEAQYNAISPATCCPVCLSHNVTLMAGRELLIDAVEVEA